VKNLGIRASARVRQVKSLKDKAFQETNRNPGRLSANGRALNTRLEKMKNDVLGDPIPKKTKKASFGFVLGAFKPTMNILQEEPVSSCTLLY
jgi:pyocin large subunit-like protein